MKRNQAIIGVLMLNTDFPRPKGDIGNPESFKYPCKIVKLDHSQVSNVVSNAPLSEQIQQEFEKAALQLQSEGVRLITTSCGFLCPTRDRIQQQLKIPFLPTSLMLIPQLRSLYGSRIGVLTFDSRKLSKSHFCGYFDENIEIAGIENGRELYQVISENRTELNTDQAQQDVLQAASELQQKNIRCLILECTNLSPYKSALLLATGLPVFDLIDYIHWLVAAGDC